MHDPSKVLLGGTRSSDKSVTAHLGDHQTFEAGLAVRRDGSGLSLDSGSLIGVSLGRDLSRTDHVAVLREGLDVPIQLTNEGVLAELQVGDITFTSKIFGLEGNEITIALVNGETDGAASVSVADKDIVVTIEDGVTDADTIKSAIDNHLAAADLVSVEVATGQGAVGQDAAAEANLADGTEAFSYVAPGLPVYVNSTGKAASGGTLTGAIYASGPLSGVHYRTKAEVPAALIDAPGGL